VGSGGSGEVGSGVGFGDGEGACAWPGVGPFCEDCVPSNTIATSVSGGSSGGVTSIGRPKIRTTSSTT
jgi:hypothetical protein